jgi:hypothetical protein
MMKVAVINSGGRSLLPSCDLLPTYEGAVAVTAVHKTGV